MSTLPHLATVMSTRFRSSFAAYVAGYGKRNYIADMAVDVVGRRHACLRLAPRDDDLGPMVGHAASRSQANAPAGASNDGNLTAQIEKCGTHVSSRIGSIEAR